MTTEEFQALEGSAVGPLEPLTRNLTPARAANLRQRMLEQVSAELPATRDQRRLRHSAVLLLAALPSMSIFLAWGGVRLAPRPFALALLTASGAAAIASVAMFFAWHRGRSMLGRPKAWLLVVTFVTPVALLAWKISVSAQFPGMMRQWLERPGVRCLDLSLLLAVAPLLAVLLLRRGTDPLHPRLTGATLGSAVAASAWVFVDLFCPVAYVPHLVLGHVLPLVLTVAFGALVGGRLLAVRK